MQNYKIIMDLLSDEVCKGYVKELLPLDPHQIALKYKNKLPCDSAALALVVQLYQKAQDKLPLWVQHFCALTSRSIEQATSQKVALYKSTLLHGKKLLVLGGGLGVDEWAFSEKFSEITSIDTDEGLNELVAFNHKKLNLGNIFRKTTSAEEFLTDCNTTFDCIYTDPDRRDEKGARKITLQNSQPNIIQLLPQIFSVTDTLVIKASPLLDIGAALKELKNVKEVRVIAWRNEVKEILLTVEKNYTSPPKIIAANYENETGWTAFEGPENTTALNLWQPGDEFFFEPNVAIIKAGLSHAYAAQLQLHSVDDKTAYYTAGAPIEGFQGRSLGIVKTFPFSKSSVKQYLEENGIEKANVARRNFRLNPDEIKKLFKIKDGGADYLFFTQQKGAGIVFHCRPINGSYAQ